eukprot:scaffold44163_cov65-Cyclotella_meneghiniana.AAC.2
MSGPSTLASTSTMRAINYQPTNTPEQHARAVLIFCPPMPSMEMRTMVPVSRTYWVRRHLPSIDPLPQSNVSCILHGLFFIKLTLPPFNGPSEGLVLGASLSFISFLWGPMYWQTTSVIDGILISGVFTSFIGEGGGDNSFSFLIGRVRNMDLIVLASVFGLVQEVSLKMLSVSHKYGIQALWTTVPNFVMIVSTLVMICSDSTLMLRRSRTVMHLIAGLFTKQTTQLMLDHVVEEPYEVLKRYSLFPQILLALVMVYNNQNGALFLSSEILDRILFVYTAGLRVYLVFKIRIQIFEICDVLGIYCFDITSVHPNKMDKCVEEEGDKKTN